MVTKKEMNLAPHHVLVPKHVIMTKEEAEYIFEETKKSTGILIAFTSGFFLDIFSSRFMGYNIIILLISAYFIKFIFRKYVRIPFVKET